MSRMPKKILPPSRGRIGRGVLHMPSHVSHDGCKQGRIKVGISAEVCKGKSLSVGGWGRTILLGVGGSLHHTPCKAEKNKGGLFEKEACFRWGH